MSRNDPARLHSRRAFLSSTAAVAAVGTVAAPALAGSDPAPSEVDSIFRRWCAVQAEMAEATGYTDEWIDEKDAAATAIEDEIYDGEACIMGAAAIALFSLRYGIFFTYTKPADVADDTMTREGARLALAVLPFLLPSLHGAVAAVATDFLGHPDREVRHSLLFTGRIGGA